MLSKAFLAVAGAVFNLFSTSIAHKVHTYNASQFLANQDLETPYPYEFPVLREGSQADSGQFPMPLCHGFKLEEASIEQLQHALSNGTLTSVQIVLCYMQRIYQTDQYVR